MIVGNTSNSFGNVVSIPGYETLFHVCLHGV